MKKKRNNLGAWIGIGIGVGTAVGVANDDILIGLGVLSLVLLAYWFSKHRDCSSKLYRNPERE